MLFDLIVTSQVERLAHALNVSLRKERSNVHLKARRFRHCASQVLDYMDVAVSFVYPTDYATNPINAAVPLFQAFAVD
jgi:hypothetical protein